MDLVEKNDVGWEETDDVPARMMRKPQKMQLGKRKNEKQPLLRQKVDDGQIQMLKYSLPNPKIRAVQFVLAVGHWFPSWLVNIVIVFCTRG